MTGCTRKAIAAAVILAFLPLCASAAYLDPVAEADWTGSISTAAGQVYATDGWTQVNGGLVLSWDITESAGVYTYSYTFANTDGSTPLAPETSHALLEVSSIITADNVDDYIWNGNFDLEGPDTYTTDPDWPDEPAVNPGDNKANPNLPADIYGIKMDTGQTTYTLQSTQQPMWGNFYTKDGQPESDVVATAWNTGLWMPSTCGYVEAYVPVPDTEPGPGPGPGPIPEPSTILLMGLGMIGYALRRRKQ